MKWNIVPKISGRTEFSALEELCCRVISICNFRSLKEGVCIHSPIIKLDLHDQLVLNNNLLSLYAKCFTIDHARHFFDEMPYKDVVSWTGILSAYTKSGNHEEALELFDVMLASGQYPNEYTFSSVLRSCAALGEFNHGLCTQSYMIKRGFELNPVLGSTLIELYSKCGKTEEAFKVFKNMKSGDIISWTTMISSFVEARNWSKALELYLLMIKAGIFPNEFAFTKVLAASSFISLECGKSVHTHMIMLEIKLNLILKTALVDMYAKSQKMEDALKVMNQTPESDVFLWTAVISGFNQSLEFNKAISAFCVMEALGIKPNNFTYAGILNSCSSMNELKLGVQIHSRVILARLEDDISVANALVDMYMNCSNTVEDALRAFREINSPNIISWTSLIAGYAKHGLEQQALQAFAQMRTLGVKPNSFTLSSILCEMKSLKQIRNIQGYIIKTNAHSDIVVANALLDAYAVLGMVNDALDVVLVMDHRDIITYTSLVTRLNQMGDHEKALKIINIMCNDDDDDVKMDGFSFAAFLSASASLAAIEPGKQLHGFSIKSGLSSNILVSNGLVDMYGKCGSINEAVNAFREIMEPDLVSWNGLINGFASNGHISSALSTFEDMKLKGIEPDSITYLLVLFACSHGGLIDLGLQYFQSINLQFLHLDHYICLVDLLGRAGRLAEAMDVINTMPFDPNALIYKTLLGACKLHKNIYLAEDIARRGLQLDPCDPAFYVILANTYDECEQSDLGEKTRMMMRERGLKKNPGHSWMEIRNKIHLFISRDRSHPKISEIHQKIKSLIIEFRNSGYLYRESGASIHHSEKLAVAFGLLYTTSLAPIRIIKDIRICRDCHEFMMNLTRLVDREIIVRDGNRFHSFKKGLCSCRGYW